MTDSTRRRFLRAASVSGAALGLLGALPTLARAEEPPAVPMPPATPAGITPSVGIIDQPVPLTGPLVVYIDDAASGKGTIFLGEQAIVFDDAGLVHRLRAAIA